MNLQKLKVEFFLGSFRLKWNWLILGLTEIVSIETTPVSAPTAYCNLKARSPGAGSCVEDALALYLLIASVKKTEIHMIKTIFVSFFSLFFPIKSTIFTAQIFGWTIHWWHPNIRWSGVHIHNKSLRWCSNRNVKTIMNLQPIRRWDFLFKSNFFEAQNQKNTHIFIIP